MSEKLAARLEGLTYHAPSVPVAAVMGQLRRSAIDFMTFLDASIPECREKSLAVTAFEESMMWAMKGLSLTDPDGKVVSP